jgi:hypothetical protein
MLIRIVEKHNNCFLKSRDQRRKGEINNLTSAIVSAPETDKITIHANYGTPSLNISLGIVLFTFARNRARICKCLRSLGIDSDESISPTYVAWRAGTTKGLSYWPARVGIDS